MPRILVSLVFWVLAIGLVATAFVGFLADRFWLFDLISNLRLPILLLALIVAVIALATKRYLVMLLAIAAMVPHIVVMAVHLPAQQPNGGRPLSVGTINLLWSHGDPDQAAASLSELNLDLLVVQEKSTQWNASLDPLRERYPFSAPRSPAFSHDLMVFSRWPIIEVTRFFSGGVFLTGMIVDLQVEGHVLTVLAVHAPTPTSASRTVLRNAFLERVAAEVVSRPDRPVLAIGDFNVTPYSPSFRILTEAGLSNDASSGTPLTTWPTWLPLVGLPIDHVLVNDRIAIGTVERGPDIGADHFPVIAHIRILD